MVDSQKYHVEFVKDNSSINMEFFIKMIIDMAQETENKKLDKDLISKSIQELILTPDFGFYQISRLDLSICGMNMVTYEYNIELGKKIIWLQSVFVVKEARSKGVFRGLLRKLEDLALSDKNTYHNSLKLYMDKDNKVAQQIYLKSGFKITEDILYEIDFYFDKFDKNKLDCIFRDGITLKICTSENRSFLKNQLEKTDFIDINQKTSSYNLKLFCDNINKVIDEKNIGQILMLSDEKNDKLIALFYIFNEYSDWRKSIFWWVYSIKVNLHYMDYFSEIKEIVMKKVINLALNSSKCGIRFIMNEISQSFWKDCCLEKSHYLILEKNLS